MVGTIEWHPGKLFLGVGFVVTNLPMEPVWVSGFYNRRVTAEQHIQEGKYAFHWTRLSSRRFRDNQVRLEMHALAFNLAVFLANGGSLEPMAEWSPQQPASQANQARRSVRPHARTNIVQLVEVAMSEVMILAVLAAIRRLRAPPGGDIMAASPLTSKWHGSASISTSLQPRESGASQQRTGAPNEALSRFEVHVNDALNQKTLSATAPDGTMKRSLEKDRLNIEGGIDEVSVHPQPLSGPKMPLLQSLQAIS